MPNYADEPVYEYGSVDDFEQALSLPGGIHKICLAGELSLDVLISGNLSLIAQGYKIPVFFTGAVTSRELKTGPFFSGGGISRALGTPFVSIADPLISRHDSIGIGWYTGTPASPAMGGIARVVKKISWFFERNVLAIGGSAGGFASLSLAADDSGISALVWNPQTNILNYVPDFVIPYLDVLFEGEWSAEHWKETATQKFESAGLIFDLTVVPPAKNFLYLQNHTDWHVIKHCAPFIESHQMNAEGDGRYTNGANGTIQIANFEKGHTPPKKQLIQDAISLLCSDRNSTEDALHALGTMGHLADTDFKFLPEDLRCDSELLKELRLHFGTQDGKIFNCQLAHADGNMKPLSCQFHAIRKGDKIGSSRKTSQSSWSWRAKGVERIECDLWDGFGHYIGRISSDVDTKNLGER
ncbi:MAG: hypothetical protein ACTIA3_12390 [Corynebacterium casei]|uniref:hypothetical protein n=3 Tax=Corynebacterium casei TaxID=160386 RepID=UPI003F8E8D1F